MLGPLSSDWLVPTHTNLFHLLHAASTFVADKGEAEFQSSSLDRPGAIHPYFRPRLLATVAAKGGTKCIPFRYVFLAVGLKEQAGEGRIALGDRHSPLWQLPIGEEKALVTVTVS